MCCVKDLRTGAQTMEDFAKKPFTRINAAAFGEILRPNLARQVRNLGRLSYSGMVFPEPSHRCGVLRKTPVQSKWPAVGIDGQRRAPGSIHAEADHLLRLEATHILFCLSQRLLDRDLPPPPLISPMFAGPARLS